MEFKNIVYILLVLMILLISVYIDKDNKEVGSKAVATIQYTKPIGPSQETPYILESGVLEGIPLK